MSVVSWGVGIVALIAAIILLVIIKNESAGTAILNPLFAIIGFIVSGFMLKYLKALEEGTFVEPMRKVYVTMFIFAVLLCAMVALDIRMTLTSGIGYGIAAFASSVLLVLSYSGIAALLKAFAVLGFLTGIAEFFASAFDGVIFFYFI